VPASRPDSESTGNSSTGRMDVSSGNSASIP
jgi:hypothetical protein